MKVHKVWKVNDNLCLPLRLQAKAHQTDCMIVTKAKKLKRTESCNNLETCSDISFHTIHKDEFMPETWWINTQNKRQKFTAAYICIQTSATEQHQQKPNLPIYVYKIRITSTDHMSLTNNGKLNHLSITSGVWSSLLLPIQPIQQLFNTASFKRNLKMLMFQQVVLDWSSRFVLRLISISCSQLFNFG